MYMTRGINSLIFSGLHAIKMAFSGCFQGSDVKIFHEWLRERLVLRVGLLLVLNQSLE